MSWTISDVKIFAQKAHSGQKRWSGADYYEDHILKVYENTKKILDNNRADLDWYFKTYQINESDILAAALLHDTIEDTEVTFQELADIFNSNVAGIVRLLTHEKNVDYAEYIFNLIDSYFPEKLAACIIKISDLQHNCLNFPNGKSKYSIYLLSKRLLENFLTDQKKYKNLFIDSEIIKVWEND